MVEIAQEVFSMDIEEELRQSYLDYAMSVIVGRALPDVRDGLKPVHRRVLFAMHELGNVWNKPYKKSARVVGDVIGKYHPHGDSAVYDTMVRMAQPFSLRYLLVDGQGNFGSIDGDNAAAMRYTEVRMSRMAHELLADIDYDTVNFVPNYDNSEQMPSVLPARVPNLLINGSSGIAVGMATNIPPHNLGEVIDACVCLLDAPESNVTDLMQHIKGPDFPTAAFINGSSGIREAYETGRGRIYMRARSHIETDEKTGRQSLIFTEIPFQLNKSRLMERIAELVKEKKVEGISELRDESDKDGVRVVVELKRNEVAEVVLNNLYAHSQLEMVFGINMVALDRGQPKVLNLKQILTAFLNHRREVVTRRTLFLLRKARERGHLLEGLAVALANIDKIIALIKASASTAEAKEALTAQSWQAGPVLAMLERTGGEQACRPETLEDKYGLHDGVYFLSAEQATAILDLRLQKLTGLEHEKIIQEYEEKLAEIVSYLEILGNESRLVEVIRDELWAIKKEYADPRRSVIIHDRLNMSTIDLITNETVALTLSHHGYAKIQPLEAYRAQKRGGRGKAATAVKEEDFIEHLVVAQTHDTVLCFTTRGKVYWLKVYNIPSGGRASRGKPLVNLLPLEENERVTAFLVINDSPQDHYVFMATAKGVVKKVMLSNFMRPRSVGLIAVDLDADDTLIGVEITNGQQDVMLFSTEGKCVRFAESLIRGMGRTARGVRGMRIPEKHRVISLIIPKPDVNLLMASLNGFGKRTPESDFPKKGRGGSGVIALKTSERNGAMVAVVQLEAEAGNIMLISNQGTLVRTPTDTIPLVGRNTQGVRLIRLSNGEQLVGIEEVEETEIDEDVPVSEIVISPEDVLEIEAEDESTDEIEEISEEDDDVEDDNSTEDDE